MRTTVIALGVGLVALGVVIGLLIVDQIDRHRAPAIVIEDPRLDSGETGIVVSVEGEVVNPGVYSLFADARVQHALDAAGGPTADADLTGFNLAARLEDEARLIVPARSTTPLGGAGQPTGQTPTAPPDPTAPTSQSGLVNINTADAATLDTLPGIGPALAAAIIADRETNGSFRTIDDLARVRGISLAMVDAMRAMITV